MVLINHSVYDGVNLLSLGRVLLVSLLPQFFSLDHLLLDISLHVEQLLLFILLMRSSRGVRILLSSEHFHLNLGVSLL